ncbi:MAG: hypothetical protein NUV51_11105 [Sulfuricaulis sp.]|nr:hypothetical protein [Sulfuricaulis sp.]
MGAKLNINRRANDARQAAAYAKLGADIALRRDATAAVREGHYLAAGTAREKTAAESVGRGAMAAKTGAETEELGVRRLLAAEYLRKNPGDVAGASVVLKGGALPGPTFSESLTSMADPKTGAITLLQRSGPGAGAVRKAVPTGAPYTQADFNALKAKYPSKTAAQILNDLRTAGQDVSQLRP